MLALGLAAGCTRPNPDFVGDGVPCTPGARRCEQNIAQVCLASGAWQVDRPCPGNSTCTAGVCTPDPAARPCASVDGCPTGTVCTAFVNPGQPGTLSTFCAAGIGQLPSGSPCASNGDCLTGLCVGERPSAICYQACATAADCPPDLQCVDVSVTVDGVRGQGLKGCLSRRR